jgi:chromosome segregation ATPase
METIQNRLKEILNNAKTNNTNLEKVLRIILTKQTEQNDIINNLLGEKLSLQNKIDELIKTSDTFSENIEVLEKEKKNKEEEVNKLNIELGQLKDNSNLNITENEAEIIRLTTRIRELSTEVDDLKLQIVQNKEEKGKLVSEQGELNNTNSKELEELKNKLNIALENLRIEKLKAEAINGLIDEIETELGQTNDQIRSTIDYGVSNNELSTYPTRGGKSMKMKKHHKKHLKRKTRKIRNKKHKSK